MKKIASILPIILISACTLSPGMDFEEQSKWLNNNERFVFVGEGSQRIKVNIKTITISDKDIYKKDKVYKIGNGDQLNITIWGLPELFPVKVSDSEQSLRVVGADGKIFFPYIGETLAAGLSESELRISIESKLKNYFNNPQVDVSVAGFKSKKVYLLGEFQKKGTLPITNIPLTLSDAIGEMNGFNQNTSNPEELYIIRNSGSFPVIYNLDFSSPSSFIIAQNFYLSDKDIVYVNSSGTTQWNRVISQFFPFSSFLNSVDNLLNDDS